MMKAVQNCVEHVGIALPEAVNMATLYPARSLSMDNQLGLIRRSYTANMVVFDKNYQVKEVYLKGNKKMIQ
jgi:N-acetylglucosamine-6-phosphate deacetylase